MEDKIKKVNIKHYTLCFCYFNNSDVRSFFKTFFNYEDLMAFIFSFEYSIMYDTIRIYTHTDSKITFMSKLTYIPCDVDSIVY